MLKRFKKKAQTTAEYAVLIALVIGAVVAMQVYVRRGLSGRIRDVVDHVGVAGEVGGTQLQLSGNQYDPYYLASTSKTDQTATDNEILKDGSAIERTSTTSSTADRTQTYGWFGREK